MAEPMLDTGQSFSAMWWVARAAGIGCVLLTLVCLALIGVIIAILPLKEIQPMFVTSAESKNQIIKIESLEKNTKGHDLLLMTLARQYVELRESINEIDQVDRVYKLGLFTGAELMNSFKEAYLDDNHDSPYSKFSQRKINREVKILSSINLAPSAPDVWQVEWESMDKEYYTHHEVAHKTWISVVHAECEDQTVNLDDQYTNPLGFTVKHYSVASKN